MSVFCILGVALFHARAGNWEKAIKLAEPLKASVAGLTMLNNEVGVLNESGTAMLQAMEDFLILIRLMWKYVFPYEIVQWW